MTLVFAAAAAVGSTVLFGLAPALQAGNLDILRTMRGEVAGTGRPTTLRHGLIAAQVGGAALLLICAAVFLRGALIAARSDPGIRTTDTISVQMENELLRPVILQELAAAPLVAAVAASSPGVVGRLKVGTVEGLPEAPARSGDIVRQPPSTSSRRPVECHRNSSTCSDSNC